MGVRTRRWQLWLITTFILTGMIGMIQLFKGPESVGAVTVAGGSMNQPVALPTRSSADQATQLPAWAPTDDVTAKAATSARTTAPRVVATTTRPSIVVTSGTRATQLPSSATQSAAATRSTSVTARTVPSTAMPTTPAPVTTTPKVKTAKPTPTPVRTTSATATRWSQEQPTTQCYRILWWVRCR